VEPVTTTPAKAAVKALHYAEVTLGVHTVYEDAIKQRDQLDKLMLELGDKRDAKRAIEAQMQDREFELMGDERSIHPEMSQAQMDKHIKVVFHQDPTLQELRQKHMAVVNDVDGMELDRSVFEADIRIAVARMTELGGYFQFLAAVKTQSTNTDNT
jgi:hypothetical protein